MKKFKNEVSRFDQLDINVAAENLYMRIVNYPCKISIKRDIQYWADKHVYKKENISVNAYNIIKINFPKYILENGDVKWNSKFVNKNSYNLHLEHIIPNSYIYQMLVDEFENKDLYNKKDEGINFIKELLNIHVCGLITNDECKILDSKFKSIMPNGWNITDDPKVRLTIAGIKMM